MKEIIEKLSSYNIFNNLLPGILFSILAKATTNYDFIQTDVFLGSFLYYFIGLIISRFGSLVIENVLIKIKFVRYADYKKFLLAQKNDENINILLESNNMFRTLSSMGILLLILYLYDYLSFRFEISTTITYILLTISIVILFLYSFRKQTDYIRKRVEYLTDNTQSQEQQNASR